MRAAWRAEPYGAIRAGLAVAEVRMRTATTIAKQLLASSESRRGPRASRGSKRWDEVRSAVRRSAGEPADGIVTECGQNATPAKRSRAIRCDTGATLLAMPTRHRRHAVTETPPVQAALDELRGELGDATRIELGELVILGANQKVAQLRAARADTTARRRRLAERVRRRDVPVDRAAADAVRRTGWDRP